MTNPSPAEILALRKSAGLSQTAAAQLIGSTMRTWQNWEAQIDAANNRKMPAGMWELFQIKTANRALKTMVQYRQDEANIKFNAAFVRYKKNI